MWEGGILEKWKKDLQPSRVAVCLAKQKTISPITQESIKLVDLTSAFFVLGVGVIGSLIAFLYEILSKFFGSKRSNKT